MTTTLPRAVLLDLDDTILNDSADADRHWREACLACQSEFGGVDLDAVLAAVDQTRQWFWADADRHRVGRLDLPVARREIVQAALTAVGVDNPVLAGKIAEIYGGYRNDSIHPLPEAIDTVRWLRDRGCRLALLTNGAARAQRQKIERFALGSLFDRIFIEGELGFGKPDPRVYALALEQLGVASSSAWMVGDNLEWDVAQPQRQGIFGIWVDVRDKGLSTLHTTKPDRIIRRLSELRNQE